MTGSQLMRCCFRLKRTPVTIEDKRNWNKGQTVDKNNIIIDEFKASEASGKNAELNLSTTQGYVDGDKLVLPTVGNKGTAEVKYHTYKFDTNGNEVGAYTKKVDITAVAENAITTTGFNMTFASKVPNWDKDTASNQLAINSGKDAISSKICWTCTEKKSPFKLP